MMWNDWLTTLVLMRIGQTISIYRALHTIFRDPGQANSWLHRGNAAAIFGGEPAIKLMCSGRVRALEAVRDHLEVQLK